MTVPGGARIVWINNDAVHAGPAVIALVHFTRLFADFLRGNPCNLLLEADATNLSDSNFRLIQ